MPNCDMCLMHKAVEQELETLKKNQETLFERQLKDTKLLERVDTTLGGLETAVNKLNDKLEAVDSKPGKRWENLISTIISALVGAGVAYIALKFK